jgi:hypothetical protein
VAARLPASVSAVNATAVILDFVMVVSIRFKVGRPQRRDTDRSRRNGKKGSNGNCRWLRGPPKR